MAGEIEMSELASMSKNAWYIKPSENPSAKYRMFCFHFAGGAANSFGKWPSLFGEEWEIVAIQLPGRWERLSEPPLRKISEIVSGCALALQDQLDRPFAIVGYSMGSLIAFEWIRLLSKKKERLPFHFFPMAKSAPQITNTFPRTYTLSDSDFVRVISRVFRGMPHNTLDNAEFLKTFLPALKADTEAFETYTFIPGEKLAVPITPIGGDRDPILTPTNLSLWQELTSLRCVAKEFPGGHFFTNGNEKNGCRLH